MPFPKQLCTAEQGRLRCHRCAGGDRGRCPPAAREAPRTAASGRLLRALRAAAAGGGSGRRLRAAAAGAGGSSRRRRRRLRGERSGGGERRGGAEPEGEAPAPRGAAGRGGFLELRLTLHSRKGGNGEGGSREGVQKKRKGKEKKRPGPASIAARGGRQQHPEQPPPAAGNRAAEPRVAPNGTGTEVLSTSLRFSWGEQSGGGVR